MRNTSFKLDIRVALTTSTRSSDYIESRESIVTIDASPPARVDWNCCEVECTTDELNEVGYIGNSITLEHIRNTRDGRIASSTRRTFTSKQQKNYFSVADVIAIILRFERRDRPKSALPDGVVDRDQIHFDGLYRMDDGAYRIDWV